MCLQVKRFVEFKGIETFELFDTATSWREDEEEEGASEGSKLKIGDVVQ